MKRPDFDELIGRDLPEAERERLRRVHDLLVAAGPPAEVPPSLAEPPTARAGGEVLPKMRVPPRRRVALLVAAALVALAFGVGYLIGDRGESEQAAQTFFPREVVQLKPVGERSEAAVFVQLGEGRGDGNWTMLLTAENLPHLPRGDYYTLSMTKGGKRVVVCGTFNVEGGIKRTTVRFNVAYDRSEFDGWSLTRYWRKGHRERELLRA